MNHLVDSPVGVYMRAISLFTDLIITFIFSFIIHLFLDLSMFLIAVVFSYLYAVFLPIFWNGYTIGKRLFGIRISQISGGKLTFTSMIIRGCFIPILYSSSAGILLIVSIYLVSTREDKRSIHDLLAQTYVTSNLPEQES
ncbi:RDD family protein [Alkalihalobacillus sp. 1P02AB]|uniref:RDD family protein n=1 Tax=Alkalihalobacillus sp. 1P02AB TaxID=3132260 RepID=UPI0039A4954D